MENSNSNTIIERFEFKSGEDLFKAKVYRPSDLIDCKGIVIFTHGLGYCDRQYKIDGDFFARNNYLMMTYNLRGHANSPGEWTLQASIDDLSAAINALILTYPFVNNQRICVMGHSTGALISLLAALNDVRIKFASVITIVTCLTDSYLHWFNSGFNIEVKDFFKSKGVLPPIIEKFLDDKKSINQFKGGEFQDDVLRVEHRYGMMKSSSFRDFFSQIAYSPNVLECAQQIKIPILFFRGEYDEVMDVWKTNELYETLGGRVPSKLFVTMSRNHFHNDRWDMIQNETLKFFDEFCDYSSKKIGPHLKDILLVDDDELITRTLGNLLKRDGFQFVTIANDGMSALNKIEELKRQKNKDFDLIIADIRMPNIDGIETLKRARKIMGDSEKRRPVIFITGHEGKRTQEEASDVGYVDYLYKPLDASNFLSSVRKQLS